MSAPVSAKDGLFGSTAVNDVQDRPDGFPSMIDVYQHCIGSACRAVPSHLPALLKSFPSSGGTVLDNACGTGAASQEFLEKFPTAEIYAADVAPLMVHAFKAIMGTKKELQKQVKEVRLEDAQSLTFTDDMFDASITNFGIVNIPDPIAGAKQIYRTLKPGGTVIVTAWKTFGFKPILWEIQEQVKPADPLTELHIEPWCDSALLEKILKAGGFSQVNFTVVKDGLWGENKEDFKRVLLENLVTLTARNWTEEEQCKLPAMISQVVDEQQDKFSVTDGGKVGCMMEAWVAVATK